MPMINERQSAKIYEFPLGGARGLNARKARNEQDIDLANMPVIMDNCWYHEEAMRPTVSPKN